MKEASQKGNKIAANIIASVSVQALSLLVSLISGFLIPKFIDEYQYAYREIYMLYGTYVGLLHFGLLDGILLRYAQYDYDRLDKERLRSQFRILLGSLLVISVSGILLASILLDGVPRSIVILLSIGAFTKNLVTYHSYCFQITNRIGGYVRVIFCQRLTYGILIAIFLLCGINRFEWYCAAELLGDVVAVAISYRANRKLCMGRSLRLSEALTEWKHNMAAGAILLVSNLSANLLLGSAKMAIQWRWDELTFGKVSFAFSITTLFLTFITAISVVLFPSLKRLDESRLPELYGKIRGGVSPMLFAVLLLYFPGCFVLERFLPSYTESLKFLGLLLPLVVYSSKVNLLTNNYLKAYRKEKTMLLINLSCVVCSAALFLVASYVWNSLYAVFICVVIAIMMNSVISEIAVMRTIRVRFVKEFFIEAFMTAVFVLATTLLDLWIACAVYAAVLTVYLILERKHLIPLLRRVIRK